MLLLDTHALLWLLRDDRRLSRGAREHIRLADSACYSQVSLWEIGLKLGTGGFDFDLPDDWHLRLPTDLQRFGYIRLDLEAHHCRGVQDLPFHHRDPFDRMLIAQALAERADILSCDPRFDAYPVRRLW